MNKKRFWLRFIFFFFVFAVAISLMIFIVNGNPRYDFRLLLIKIGALAIASSLFYNIFIERDAGIVD